MGQSIERQQEEDERDISRRTGHPGGDQQHQGGAAKGGRGQSRGKNESTLQIVVTWLSGLLLLTIVGYLVWEGTRAPSPADFSYQTEAIREATGSFHVPLLVINRGGESVQGLVVSLELVDGESVVERSSVTLDWLPEGSKRRVVLVFEQDPRLHQMKVGFDGYQVP